MELSNLWDIPELADQAVQAIIELRLIRFDNCDDSMFSQSYGPTDIISYAFIAVLARAEAAQMTVLIDICRKTKAQNRWA